MRILFAGTPSTAASVLEGLIGSGHDVVAVLTREDAPTGRKKLLTPSPVAELGSSKGIPVIKANSLSSDVLAEISSHKVDFAIVVAYGVILKQEALDLLPKGWFNLHFSVLPKWRGAAPVQRAIQHGDSSTGVTLFKIDKGLDTGPVLGALETSIGPDENAGELLERLSMLGLTLLNEQLPKLYAGTESLTEQDGVISLAPKTSRAEAKLDFAQTDKVLENLVRAMNPEPMAWCLLEDQPMRVIAARAYGEIFEDTEVGVVFLANDRVLVSCSNSHALELIEVQPSSRNAMSAKDWFNGLTEAVKLS